MFLVENIPTASFFSSSSFSPSIDALKSLEQFISQQIDAVIQRIDSIVSGITLQLRLVFAASIQNSQEANVARLCKHIVNVLVGIFSNATLAMGNQKNVLVFCVQ